MLGAIVGDVIGSPYERANVKSTNFRFFAHGTQCTDDAVLTVATADVLLRGDVDYARTYQDYFHRFPNAGYGGRFVAWANRRETRPYGSWGNGSAMRVGPVGWARETLDDVLDEAERSAAVTHDHPDGIKGAQAVAACVFLARTERSRDRIRQFVHNGCGYPPRPHAGRDPPDVRIRRQLQGDGPRGRAGVPRVRGLRERHPP